MTTQTEQFSGFYLHDEHIFGFLFSSSAISRGDGVKLMPFLLQTTGTTLLMLSSIQSVRSQSL